MLSRTEIFGYAPKKEYSKSVAYFSMEFAIDQSLKIYSGGLGFLSLHGAGCARAMPRGNCPLAILM